MLLCVTITISIAPVIGLVIGKAILLYQLHLAFWYQIGTITEKASDTDACI